MHGNSNSETLTLSLRQRSDRTLYWDVRVQSAVRPGLRKIGILEFKDATRLHVQALAGALAEQLCLQYKDMLDPDQVAAAAGEAYDSWIKQELQPTYGDELPRYADGRS